MLIEVALILAVAVLLCMCVNFLGIAQPSNKVAKIIIVIAALLLALIHSGALHALA